MRKPKSIRVGEIKKHNILKQLFFIMGFISLTIFAKAQITLEHTFTTSSPYSLKWFNSDTKGIMYYLQSDTITNQLKIYNEDYSLYKTITIPRPKGYEFAISNASEQLFNTDNSIEFICGFFKKDTETGLRTCILRIYDENTNLITDFGTFNQFPIMEIINYSGRNSKLVISVMNSSNTYEIYSLPGNLPNKTSELQAANIQSAYPNPSKTIVNLSYSLDNGQTSTMRIYKTNGQLVEQKQIDSAFDKIQLNVNSYQPGMYVYEYNGVSNKFTVK